VFLSRPRPIAAISQADSQALTMWLPQLSILDSHSGKFSGIVFGRSFYTSAGLSPIGQKNLHFASYYGGKGDNGLLSSGRDSTNNL